MLPRLFQDWGIFVPSHPGFVDFPIVVELGEGINGGFLSGTHTSLITTRVGTCHLWDVYLLSVWLKWAPAFSNYWGLGLGGETCTHTRAITA